MRTYCRYILIVLLLSCAVSCTTNDEMADPKGEGKMSLRLVSSAMTRASDGQHNEDFLDKVDLYLFGDTAEASKWHTTIDTDANGSLTLKDDTEIFIPASALNSVGDSPKLYVIANYDNTTSPLPESATLDALQKQVVAKASWGPTSATQTWNEQSSFVMEGLGDVTKTGNQLSGIVNLKRAAAKIDLSITDIVDEVVSGDYVWKPVVGTDHALNVTLKNAVTTSYVGADWDKTYEYFGTDGSTVNYTFTAGTPTIVDGVTTTPYSQTYPFYSYSSDQAKGASETYMVLAVPWQRYKDNKVDGDVDYRYYEIPIGDRDNKLIERNFHYKVSIYVGTLGSTNADESVELEPEITVVDWSTGQIAVDIKTPKYLVVDETVINIYNQNQYDIAYASSHPVSAVITKITKPDYSDEEEATVTIYNESTGATTVTPANSISGNKESFTVSIVDGKVRLSHVLNNNNKTDGFDYVPYDITVVVTNDAGMSQTITYKQYPAMYIKAEKNPGGDMVGRVDKGHVFVYNNQSSDSENWCVVRTCYTGGNQNPNMYVITTTAMDASSPYILGEARSETPVTGESLDLDNAYNDRTLQYYYPSRTDNDNYIAPSFRIASSYGKCDSGMSYENAKRRCAAYQEKGYPAGRWRLPTTAEIKYIAQLSRDERIPHLFSDDGNYWTATEYITYSTTADPRESNTTTIGNNVNNPFVRCVYDEWYWGTDKCDEDVFTWGDQQK